MEGNGADTLREYIGESENCVVCTGAGISTKSGIPDFRSPSGGWTKNQPIYFQEFIDSLTAAERRLWRFPRPGHPYYTEQTLALLEEQYPGWDSAEYRQQMG